MPIYISRGRFTSNAINGMLAKPEDREEAVGKLFKSVGGRLVAWYLTFGQTNPATLAYDTRPGSETSQGTSDQVFADLHASGEVLSALVHSKKEHDLNGADWPALAP